jgi:heptosyltransferase-1
MRIVLVRLSALGDIVHTWPLADALRAARPDAHLSWVVEAPLAPLVQGHPSVDAVFTTATRRWRSRPLSAVTRAEIATLRSRLSELAPELTIDPQGTLKSAIVSRWTGAPRRVGLARPWRRELVAGAAYTEVLPGSTTEPHVIATNLALVRAVGVDPPPGPQRPDGRWLLQNAPIPTGPWRRPYAVLLPGAGQADKVLSPAILALIARHLIGRGIDAVIAWGPSERERARAVRDAAGDGAFVAPKTDLPELAGLLGAAAVAVGGDTGPVHLAASLGVPTLGVFLTTDPDRNGPVGPSAGVISGAAPSRGIGGSATTGQAHDLSAAEIVDVLERLLAEQG